MNHSTDRYVIGNYLQNIWLKKITSFTCKFLNRLMMATLHRNTGTYLLVTATGYAVKQRFKHSHSLQIVYNKIRVGESYFNNSIFCYKLYILTSDILVYFDNITTVTISYTWQPPNTERYSQFVSVDMRYRKYLAINVWKLVTSKCH